MYRRIEFINPARVEDEISIPVHKSGLMGAGPSDIWAVWENELIGPDRSLPQNCRFYFTEKGWREVGRNVVAAAMRLGQDYRIIAIKQTDAQVVWRDLNRGYEVAVQPPRKRPRRVPDPAEEPA
jgi:hypothetical protein